jgi:predicted MFS family arabinose efflux permease
MASARMAAPLLALNLGYSTAAAGVLVALFALTQIFISLPFGRYVDRHGLKRPLAFCVAGAAAGVALTAAWPSYAALCATAMITGGAVGAATITLQRHVGRLASTPTELKQAFSWFSVAPAGSNFVGPILTGLVIDHAGFRAAFLMLAGLPLIAWLLVRRSPEMPREEAHAGSPGAAWDLLRSPSMRRLLLMNWLMTAAWDLHGLMVPLVGHERGLSASAIGAVLGCFAIAAVAVRIIMPTVAGRIREWVLITGATATAGSALLLYPFTRSAISMGVCSGVIGLTLGGIQPMVMSMLHQITPRHRHGEAVAVRLMLVNMSSVAMPLLFGAAGGALGTGAVFWVMGVVLAAGSRFGTGLRHLQEEEPH